MVEFEDLLRPNEAMALLEAARVTAERRLGPVRGRPGGDFPRERWRKTMENLGKMRENNGKPMKIHGKIREEWKNGGKTEENGRKWFVYPILNGDLAN